MTIPVTRRFLLQGASALALPAGAIATMASAAPRLLPGGPAAPASIYSWPVRPLLQADLRHSLDAKVREKAVLETLVIDDMETDKGWVASDVVQLSYTEERAKEGRRSLRFSTEQRNEAYIKASRAKNGSFAGGGPLFDFAPFAASARLNFAQGQDWTRFNRISFWCYLHPTGNPVTSLCLQLICEGAESGPYDPVAINYFADFKQGEWNLLAWEIPEIRRDRIVAIQLFQPISGLPFRSAKSLLTYDIDQLRVERVAAEQVQGWMIAPDKMAFSHLGYGLSGRKLALGPAGQVDQFALVDAASRRVAATLPAAQVQGPVGQYTAYDFSAFKQPGRYRLRAGGMETEPFEIQDQPWRPLVEAVLNGFYGLRCGFAVPGAHDACHCDVTVRYKGDSRVVGGGWHDAANLSQDPNNTALSVCALFDLAEALAPHDHALSARALEEARWGLEWIHRLRFGPGLRYLMGNYSYFTNSIPGDDDDIVHEDVGSDTFKNLSCALASVRGARMLRASDPKLAAALLREAKEDFDTVLQDRPGPQAEPAGDPNWRVTPWQNDTGYIALTALELYRATRDQRYADLAARYARHALDVQEFRFIEGAPITGYFYEDAARTRIIHEQQRTSGAPNSFEEGALLAYQGLCEELPDHPDWVDWYAGLVANSEYFCRSGAAAASPFDLVPAAVWRKPDLDAPFSRDFLGERQGVAASAMFPTPANKPLIRRQMGDMFEASTYLSPSQRLKKMPMWVDHIRHGGTSVHLTKTLGLAAAAQVRKRPDLSDLASRQIQWEVGGNPFSRSLVYGIGYDWWHNFTVSLPNLVGGLSVGMNSYRDDSPAWGNNTLFPYKEIWVLSSCRLAANLARLPGSVRVKGHAPAGAHFKRLTTGQVTPVKAGSFDLALTPDDYEVSYGKFTRRVGLVDGGRCTLDLDPAKAVDVKLVTVSQKSGAVRVRLEVRGVGERRIELRASNATIAQPRLTVKLAAGGDKAIEVTLALKDVDRPWVLVAVPDGRVGEAVEAFGAATSLRELGKPT